ncbi:branched-chain amino acid aminotransferase [uncultured Georgenia sp.]|mgnify:CR=1 FL=1|uniref:branched-chain amino acid aminotransferase n=1 Tax=uncultured Georgenia sp. TaxID=378209 RepID=UPI002607F391|nr:branched-chain amino acid aminotransferase [uncultured Georgenia sp.]
MTTAPAEFAIVPSSRPRTTAERAAALERLSFGVEFTDHMARATWTLDEGWHGHRVEGFAPLELSPAAAVLHYAQEIFEGLKAYRHADGSVWAFRPEVNARRFQASARRLAMPELPEADFLASIRTLVETDIEWVPSSPGSSLYLRPFMIATEPFLGVRPAHRFEYLVIASPVGPYFVKGFEPVSIWVAEDYHRAGPGGTGSAKFGGNYAASLLPQQYAYGKGFEQVCFLDAATRTNLEELGGMNVFVVHADGVVRTPALTGTILEGVTRSSIIELLTEQGVRVEEADIPLQGLLAGIQDGSVTEVFACGTAAVITPIGRLAGESFDVTVGDGGAGPTTTRLFHRLTDIQFGRAEDTHGWMRRLA